MFELQVRVRWEVNVKAADATGNEYSSMDLDNVKEYEATVAKWKVLIPRVRHS